MTVMHYCDVEIITKKPSALIRKNIRRVQDAKKY